MPDNGFEKRNDWLALRVPGTTAVAEYEHADRANQAHNQYCVGYDIDEIAAFFGVSELDIQRDLQHVRSNLSPRQVIAINNDRARIKLQREDTDRYGKIMSESLGISAMKYIEKGMSPAGPMKEFREAVGMTEKPGGLAINFTRNTANILNPGGGVHPANVSGRGGIKSYEDLVRMVIEQDPTCGLQPIDTDAHDATPPGELDDIIGDDLSEEEYPLDEDYDETDQ